VSSLRWTEQAADDLASIRAYIERDSPRYAQLVIERLVQRAERIAEFPMAGRVVPEFGRADVREVISGSYRIVYWLEGEVQHVLTVFRSSRLFPLARDET
jgi:toxin ParE1/3/4